MHPKDEFIQVERNTQILSEACPTISPCSISVRQREGVEAATEPVSDLLAPLYLLEQEKRNDRGLQTRQPGDPAACCFMAMASLMMCSL